MERRDYIEKEIDKIGLILSKLLSLLTSGKWQNNSELINEDISRFFVDELKLDPKSLSELPDNEFIDHLINDHTFNNQNLSALADIFLKWAETTDDLNDRSMLLMQKSLIIYEFLDLSDTSFSLDRHLKKERIKQYIENIG